MNTFKSIIFLLIFISAAVHAETVYVTDQLKLDLRGGMSTRYRILKMLPSGTPLTVISKDSKTGYTKVRLSNGLEGYLLTRYTLDKPIARWHLDKANKELEQLKTENEQLNHELSTVKKDYSQDIDDKSTLSTERDDLSRELNNLKQTAANAIQLKQQRDQLQERVVNIERENQQLKRENQRLEDSSNQDWFLNGGIVAFLGIIFGLLIPKISWHRRTSSWDTF